MITDPQTLANELREIVEEWDEKTSFDPANAMSDDEHNAAIDFVVTIEEGRELSAKQIKFANSLIVKYGYNDGKFYRASDIGRYSRDT